jgi:hypothetical protein
MDKSNLLYFIRARKLSKYLLITVALFSFLSN